MLLNCGAKENSWESLGLQGDQTRSILKETNLEIFIRRTDGEAPILWPPDAKSQLIGKDPDAGKDWRQEEKGDELFGWYHQLHGPEFEQTPKMVKDREAWCAAVHGVTVRHNLATEQQQQLCFHFILQKWNYIVHFGLYLCPPSNLLQ